MTRKLRDIFLMSRPPLLARRGDRHQRYIALLVTIAIFAVLFPRAAVAHRLDEYLQAARISVALDVIRVEINLTPGAAVADEILAAIDRDRNGEISEPEGRAYAESVVKSIALDIDGRAFPLTLDSEQIPSSTDMRRGEGIIRLLASTPMPSLSVGRHRLAFSNVHRSDISVYLINALIPADDRIRITGQSRDMLQHEFKMEYTVAAQESGLGLAAVWPPALGLTLAAMLLALARRFRERPSGVPRSFQKELGKQ
jgi:hypothetical protein